MAAHAILALFGEFNAVLKETRLKPALAEDLTASLILRIAKTARGFQGAGKPSH